MITVEAAVLTDPGRTRPLNEDRAWMQLYNTSDGEPVGLFLVCDGVGGHMGGEVASHWAVEAVRQELGNLFCPPDPRATVILSEKEVAAAMQGNDATRHSDLQKLENLVQGAVQAANQVVYRYAHKKPEKAGDAGTTITMALVVGNKAVIGNVGDSRTYLLRNGKLKQITKDHSLVATLVASGQIKPQEIFVHPQRNLIYRSLGHKLDVQVDTFVEILQPDDHLVLCSDGLWEMLQDDALIARIVLQARSPEEACRKLVEAANTAGGEDNIGVVVVKVK